jgi:phosphogluconate dehydratase
VPGPTFQREHGQGMGRELFAGMRRLVRTAEEGAVTWL